MSENEEAVAKPPSINIPPLEKAAILLMSLGESDAAEILKHMGPKEVQRLGSAMSQLKNVEQVMVEASVSDFLGRSRQPDRSRDGS